MFQKDLPSSHVDVKSDTEMDISGDEREFGSNLEHLSAPQPAN